MLAVQSPSPPGEAETRPRSALSIRRAAVEAHEQRQAWRAGLEADARRYQPVRVSDAVLARIEEINLKGAGSAPGVHVAAWKRELSASLGRSLPGAVRDARTGHELHSALLDWQDRLLDEAIPERRQFTREDEQMAARLAVTARSANQLLDADHIQARYENGVLTASIPIAEPAKARRVAISTGDGAKPAEVRAEALA